MTASSKRQKREEYRKAHREEGGNTELPKKRYYRQRAHANPFSDHQLTYPINPSQMDWSPYFPAFVDHDAAKDATEGQPKPLTKPVTVADIGCGFGGLLVALAPMLPEELILGMEIRIQVTEYVQDRISALRSQHAPHVGDRRVVFPRYMVDKDTFVPLEVENPTMSIEDTKQYIIYSHENLDVNILDDTEQIVMKIGGSNKLLSSRNLPNARICVANLTNTQAEKITKLDIVHSLEENRLSEADLQAGLIPNYYNPTTLSITPSPPPLPYSNISVLRANTMKFLPNFFTRHQLTHIFLCFPDPHFKARKHKARIVSSTLCAEYAYVLRPGGCVYTITDVEDLANWMRERFEEFGGVAGKMFEEVEIPEEGKEAEWVEEGAGERAEVARMVRCIREETEEGKKVTRNGGKKFVSVWRRGEDPKWPDEVVDEGLDVKLM